MRTFTKLACLLAGSFLMTVQNASAQTASIEKQVCQNAKTQLETNQCMASAYAAADKDLNILYGSLKEKLDAALLAKLHAAQLAWITYRDANCEAESALYQGGSIQPAVRSGCLQRVTLERIAELHAIYDTGTR